MQPSVRPLVSIISNFQRPLQMKIWKKRNKSRRFVATLPNLRIGLRHKHSFHSPFFLVVSFVPLFVCLLQKEINIEQRRRFSVSMSSFTQQFFFHDFSKNLRLERLSVPAHPQSSFWTLKEKSLLAEMQTSK
jgi:hypothetical protein